MPKERVDTSIKAHFVIFGYSFFTKDLSVFRENMNNGRISIKIWSQLHFIAAYFKEFPKLLISIYSEEDIVGTAVMNLQVFLCCLFIHLSWEQAWFMPFLCRHNMLICTTISLHFEKHFQLQTWSVEKGFRQLNYKEEYYYQ